jgi:hypothetical protein
MRVCQFRHVPVFLLWVRLLNAILIDFWLRHVRLRAAYCTPFLFVFAEREISSFLLLGKGITNASMAACMLGRYALDTYYTPISKPLQMTTWRGCKEGHSALYY